MCLVPGKLTALACHMCQWAANDGTGLAKTVLQAEFRVKLACVNLNDLSVQRWNLLRKVIQDS